MIGSPNLWLSTFTPVLVCSPGVISIHSARLLCVVQGVLLSIEDNDADYYLINLAVRETRIGINLCRVSDGESALRFLHRSHGYEVAPRPDLILLDLNLPKKGGLEVLSEIQASECLSSIPVIIFTSSRLETERKKAMALGAEDYISKPQSLDELVKTISSVCGQYFGA